jgi:D-alanine-D-alanine ligase
MANEKMNLGVIFGGRSGEHAVSLMSARSVLNVLSPDKYNIIQIYITHQGNWLSGENVLETVSLGKIGSLLPVVLVPEPGNNWIYTIQVSGKEKKLVPLAKLDAVFPVLHGTFGEDGTLQGLLELADLPYVGAGVLGSSVGMDKALFKDVMRAHNIPVLDSITVTRSQIQRDIQGIMQQAEQVAGYPLFTKPANLGSSVGVSKCRHRSDLLEGLMDAARYDRRILIERGLEKAREIEVSVLGNEELVASLPGEIIPSDDFYTYNAKYLDGASELLIPAPLPDEITEQIREVAKKAYQAVDCSGMARVDFLLDRKTNSFYVSEINTIPGFTQISMYPKLWGAMGISYPQLIDRLVGLAMERKADRDQTERQYGREK